MIGIVAGGHSGGADLQIGRLRFRSVASSKLSGQIYRSELIIRIPPGREFSSTMIVLAPALAVIVAADSPAGPAPITNTSQKS